MDTKLRATPVGLLRPKAHPWMAGDQRITVETAHGHAVEFLANRTELAALVRWLTEHIGDAKISEEDYQHWVQHGGRPLGPEATAKGFDAYKVRSDYRNGKRWRLKPPPEDILWDQPFQDDPVDPPEPTLTLVKP